MFFRYFVKMRAFLIMYVCLETYIHVWRQALCNKMILLFRLASIYVCMFEALNKHAQLTKRVCIKENVTPVKETGQKLQKLCK